MVLLAQVLGHDRHTGGAGRESSATAVTAEALGEGAINEFTNLKRNSSRHLRVFSCLRLRFLMGNSVRISYFCNLVRIGSEFKFFQHQFAETLP
jgi:hypothetical protein